MKASIKSIEERDWWLKFVYCNFKKSPKSCKIHSQNSQKNKKVWLLARFNLLLDCAKNWLLTDSFIICCCLTFLQKSKIRFYVNYAHHWIIYLHHSTQTTAILSRSSITDTVSSNVVLIKSDLHFHPNWFRSISKLPIDA